MSLKNIIRKILRLDLEKGYVSDIDKFLKEFDQKHPKRSASQEKEILKYQRIYKLRDNPKPDELPNKIWRDF